MGGHFVLLVEFGMHVITCNPGHFSRKVIWMIKVKLPADVLSVVHLSE